MSAITLLSHINIRFIIFSGSYHSPFLSVFSGHKKPRKPHEMRRKRAIIFFARTTFAWFTSKDEVTNRLTASADYGVSIVESFTPPAQWVPGQTVEKDVYAVNTGSIAAFVKEDVSGKLTVTYENTTNDVPGTANGFTYVKLEEDDIKVAKDGGYLVWNDAGVENGPILNNWEAGDWKPTEEGNYIFRRAVKGTTVADTHPATDADEEMYTLEGFYFKPSDGSEGSEDKYYKILISNYKTGREATQRTPVAVDENGNLVGIPNIVYVIEKTDTAKPVSFTYDDTNADKPRLVATYTLDAAAAANYDADAVAARHAVDVENAKGEYEFAQYRQNIAEKELELENNLIKERNTLVKSARAYKEAYDAVNDGTDGSAAALNTAKTTVTGTADKVAVLATDAPYAERVLTSSDNGYRDNGATGYQKYPDAVNTAIDNFESTYGAGTTGTIGKEAEFVAAYNALIDLVEDDDNSATDAAYKTTIETAITRLENAYTALDNASADLYAAYYDIVTATTSPDWTATGLNVSAAETTYKNKLGDENVNGSYMKTVDGYKSDVTTLVDNVRAYVEARKTNNDNAGTLNQKLDEFISAIATYQTNVGSDLDGFYKAGTPNTGWLETEYSNFAAKNMVNHNGQEDYNAAKTWMGTGKLTSSTNTAEYISAAMTYDAVADAGADPAKQTAANLATTLAAYTDTAEVAKTAFHIHGVDTNELLSTDLENATSTAKTTWKTLEANPAVVPAATDLKIYINLDKDVATNWTMDPTKATLNDAMTEDTDKQKVSFYLNSILDAGETSAKLIDSVELDATMGNVFKDFTFDLDVALDSAQIIYDNDQKTIKTDAVVAPAFTLTPSLADATDIDTTVTWAAPTTP